MFNESRIGTLNRRGIGARPSAQLYTHCQRSRQQVYVPGQRAMDGGATGPEGPPQLSPGHRPGFRDKNKSKAVSLAQYVLLQRCDVCLAPRHHGHGAFSQYDRIKQMRYRPAGLETEYPQRQSRPREESRFYRWKELCKAYSLGRRFGTVLRALP